MNRGIARASRCGVFALSLALGCGSPRGTGDFGPVDSGQVTGDAVTADALPDVQGFPGVDVPIIFDDRGLPVFDVPTVDVQGMPTFDIPPIDVPPAPDRPPPPDVPTPDRPDAGTLCGTLPVAPIARPSSGDTARVSGDTTAAFNAQNPGGRAGSSSPIRPPASNATCVASRGQVVYSYTVGAAPAALRVSTSNPGTARLFDTVLWVTAACRTTLTTAACNDDDPSAAASADRRVSSSVTTEVLPAGSTVFVILGGFYPPSTTGETVDRGAFELTVQELPPVALGGACRVDGASQRCDTGLDCVGSTPSAELGACRTRGTVAGSRCRTSAPECDAGLLCNPANGVCQSPAAAGAACDGFRACAAGTACVSLVAGASRGTCVAVGTALAAPCRPVGSTGGRCNAGLVCSADVDPADTNPTCVRQAAAGGACSILRTVCPSGQSCVTVHGGLAGTCVANGTAAGSACRPSGLQCDGAMLCRSGGDITQSRCMIAAAPGAACNEGTYCGDDAGCFLTDLSDRFAGRCGANSGLGGRCGASGTCSAALECSNAASSDGGLCQVRRATGEACNRPTDRCPEGDSCVLNAGSRTTGVCRPIGSVAGASCRAGDMPCSGALTCSTGPLGGGVCQSAGTAGGACDPLGATVQCPAGQVCAASAHDRGTCRTPDGTETEPNDGPAEVAASPVTTLTARRGSLPFGDVDCVAVRVTAGGSITALVGDGNGACPAPFPGGITLDLYATDGTTWLGSSSNTAFGRCAMIDGTRAVVFPYARGLAAGVYTVCARGFRDATTTTGPIPAYVLSVSTSP